MAIFVILKQKPPFAECKCIGVVKMYLKTKVSKWLTMGKTTDLWRVVQTWVRG